MAGAVPKIAELERSLAGISLLVEASPEIIKEIEAKCRWSEHDAGDIIVDVRDMTTDVFFVVGGRLKVMNFRGESKEVALAELGPGDTFGELSAIDSNKRSARVAALEPTLLASMPGKEFRKILILCPEVALILLKRFAGLIRSLTMRVTTLSTLTDRQRVYFELLRLSEPNAEGDGSWVISNLPPHAEIAAKVGADKEEVAAAIGNLARYGVVERRHKTLIINDRDRLARLADQ